jgi:hypothetical protein
LLLEESGVSIIICGKTYPFFMTSLLLLPVDEFLGQLITEKAKARKQKFVFIFGQV